MGFVAKPTEDCRLEVSGGAISLALPKSAAINVNAKSSGGRVQSELPSSSTAPGGQEADALEGKLNGGGPNFLLRSTSGDTPIRASSALGPTAELQNAQKPWPKKPC